MPAPSSWLAVAGRSAPPRLLILLLVPGRRTELPIPICLTHSLVGNHLSPPVNISYAYAPPQMYNSGYGSPSPHAGPSYISNSGYGSSSGYYLGSSSQHRSSAYLRRCGESGPSLSTMAPQSPQQRQSQLLRHGGESDASLNLAQSFRQSYLRHCGDSDASLSAMASSGQSLPGC
ncbi:receptor homology region, transmembrane domain- and RING domain-containing protein 1 [Triticum aestivum]|uniref:receptor homology region, transmembrane domain- and RING domain-containing protein 1 n=1 Tax=Triticum aestivum TaxID=4565 RepID=UPI001D015F88|nr:receptor homology region, transmembrane domain- and RING domain-containing protein 1-like [Triticum aestivum]